MLHPLSSGRPPARGRFLLGWLPAGWLVAGATAAALFAAPSPDPLAVLIEALRQSDDPALHRDILRGMNDGLKGRRQAPMPAGWEAVAARLARSPDATVRQQAQSLSLVFGSPEARTALRETLLDPQAGPAVRAAALESLLHVRDAALAPALQRLLGDTALRGPALRALAGYDDAWTPWLIVAVYPQLTAAEKRDALNTLAARALFARVLVGAVEQKRIPARDLTAEVVRQVRSLRQPDLDARLDTLWGTMRPLTEDKRSEIARYKRIYAAGYSQPGDARRGRAIYDRICGQCHTLFESGGKVGPDLTGSNRADLDYLLQNILDPNAEIPNDYRPVTVETQDGRVLTGILKHRDARALTLQTANEVLTLPAAEVVAVQQGQLSMMPEGLLTPLSDQEVRDLLYYLRSPAQVPLPAAR